MFQNSKLIKASILDNVKMDKSNATDEEVLNALRAAQCMDIIEKFPDGIHTVIGSFGLVTVAPFTALCAGLFLARRGGHPQPQEEADG